MDRDEPAVNSFHFALVQLYTLSGQLPTWRLSSGLRRRPVICSSSVHNIGDQLYSIYDVLLLL